MNPVAGNRGIQPAAVCRRSRSKSYIHRCAFVSLSALNLQSNLDKRYDLGIRKSYRSSKRTVIEGFLDGVGTFRGQNI